MSSNVGGRGVKYCETRLRFQGRFRKTLSFAVLGCILTAGFASAPLARADSGEKSVRKLVYRAVPDYPQELKRAHIGGTVRLSIVISPAGAVTGVTPLGGNPILIDAASSAVKRWKYAPAAMETRTQVEFVFDPTR